MSSTAISKWKVYFYWTNSSRTVIARSIGFSVIKSGLPDKFWEISNATLPENRILGYGCRFQRNDTHSSAGETKCNNRLVSVDSHKRSSDSAGNCSADWETKLLCNSSSASPSPLQVPTKATNSRIFKAEKLREEGLSISRGQEELIWRANNLKLRNVRSLVNSKPQIILASDASMKDLGEGCCQGQRTGGHGQS